MKIRKPTTSTPESTPTTITPEQTTATDTVDNAPAAVEDLLDRDTYRKIKKMDRESMQSFLADF
jgi:hypothetical protein